MEQVYKLIIENLSEEERLKVQEFVIQKLGGKKMLFELMDNKEEYLKEDAAQEYCKVCDKHYLKGTHTCLESVKDY